MSLLLLTVLLLWHNYRCYCHCYYCSHCLCSYYSICYCNCFRIYFQCYIVVSCSSETTTNSSPWACCCYNVLLSSQCQQPVACVLLTFIFFPPGIAEIYEIPGDIIVDYRDHIDNGMWFSGNFGMLALPKIVGVGGQPGRITFKKKQRTLSTLLDIRHMKLASVFL